MLSGHAWLVVENKNKNVQLPRREFSNQFFYLDLSFSSGEDVRTGADLSEADAGEQIGGESSAARGRFFK